MALKKIRLELARDRDFPEGSNARGYEFRAPLTDDGHIDAAAWKAERDECTVYRFWAGQPDEEGHLVHLPGGTWAFHYDLEGDPDLDEPGYKFGQHVFKPGEYVSLTEQDGEMRTFRVVSVS